MAAETPPLVRRSLSLADNKMRAPTITDLPEELVETILQHVQNHTSRHQFWNCLQVCHKMHRIGLGLCSGLGFAASAVIESDTRLQDVREQGISSEALLKIDFNPFLPSQSYLAVLKSLTIHVQHKRIAANSSPSLGIDLVRSLQCLFESTMELTTFSLIFSDGWDFPSLDVPAVPQSLLARLVEVLPRTVINLELDTAGLDVAPSEELTDLNHNLHLCYQIRQILMRLHYLRLRVGHVCKLLVDFQPNCPGCSDQDCGYCAIDEQSTCELVSSWHMRSLIIWMPLRLKLEKKSPVQDFRALLTPFLYSSTTVLLVEQTEDAKLADSPSQSCRTFTWTPQSNILSASNGGAANPSFVMVSGGLQVLSGSVIKLLNDRKCDSTRTCPEHILMLSHKIRRYTYSSNSGNRRLTTCHCPYVAEHLVQGNLTWSQSKYLGYRYPLALANEPGKPFWKGDKLWACRFPGCKTRSESLGKLWGHIIYFHAKSPHTVLWNGVEPCPSQGCDRVESNGFKGRGQEWQQHILDHHITPCPLPRHASLPDLPVGPS